MTRFIYSNVMIDFLEDQFKNLTVIELTAAFNKKFSLRKTNKQIKSTLTNHKITCGRKVGAPKGRSRLFTKSQMLYIAEKYQLHNAERVAELLNKTCKGSFTTNQIKSFVKNHGINCSRTGHFEKGHSPWNEGTKGVMQPNSGNFPKGHVPINHRPVGSERLTKDGYRAVKIAEPNKWELLQRHNWAKVHGNKNMPDNLRFKDGNRLNCEIDNLEPVSNSEHIRLTQLGYNAMPEEIKPVVLTIAKVQAKSHALMNREIEKKSA